MSLQLPSVSQAEIDADSYTDLPAVEVQLSHLKAYGERYAAGCPHKVGDLVTPADEVAGCGQGRPHRVLEIREGAADIVGRPEKSAAGSTAAVRVAVFYGTTLQTSWYEAQELIPWTPDMRDQALDDLPVQ